MEVEGLRTQNSSIQNMLESLSQHMPSPSVSAADHSQDDTNTNQSIVELPQKQTNMGESDYFTDDDRTPRRTPRHDSSSSTSLKSLDTDFNSVYINNLDYIFSQ